MVESTIYIRNKTGLHLRLATELSQLCAKWIRISNLFW